MKKIAAFVLCAVVLFSCSTSRIAKERSWGGSFYTKNADTVKDSVTKISETAHPIPEITAENISQTEIKKTTLPSNSHISAKTNRFRKMSQRVKAVQNDPEPEQKPVEPLPMEPNSFYGFWMVIGSILVSSAINAITANIAASALTPLLTFLGIVSGLAFLCGFVLGIIGLGVHQRNPGKYRGKGKALAAVIIPAVSIIFAILLLAFILLMLFAFF